MILIADSGSTKTDWCITGGNADDIYFKSEGYNPYFSTASYIVESIKGSISRYIDPSQIEEVHFYGAGCEEDKIEVMTEVLNSVFINCWNLNANVDLLAAARGLLGHKAGFAAILGTGTNTCIYDGRNIVNNIDSLGFLLGDEGSGGAIGKKILSDYLRNKMPQSVARYFNQKYDLTPSEIISQVYASLTPNRYCAEFAKFLKDPEVDKNYTYQLVTNCFREFFGNLVSCYPDYSGYSFNCVGSIGYHFRNELLDVMDEFDMNPGLIIPSLIKELVDYHKTDIDDLL